MTVVQVDGDALVKVLVEGVNMVEAERTFVLLREAGGERRLPVFIGPPEATAIAFAMQGVPTVRPMTHDALKQAIEALGGRIDSITVGWRAGTTTFTADVRVVLPDGIERHLDWRVSDAVAIAVRCTPTPAILVPAALLVPGANASLAVTPFPVRMQLRCRCGATLRVTEADLRPSPESAGTGGLAGPPQVVEAGVTCPSCGEHREVRLARPPEATLSEEGS